MTAWMDSEDVMLSERSQTGRHMISLLLRDQKSKLLRVKTYNDYQISPRDLTHSIKNRQQYHIIIIKNAKRLDLTILTTKML